MKKTYEKPIINVEEMIIDNNIALNESGKIDGFNDGQGSLFDDLFKD